MSDRKRQIVDEVAASHREVLELVSGLKPEQLERPTENEGWSVKDTLAHLASIEARLRSMWQHGLDGREWPADDNSVDAYNERCVAERRAWPAQAVIDELKRSGEETERFLDRLAPDDFDRTFNHPTRGVVTIETLVGIIPRHVQAHSEQIRAAAGG